MHRYHKRYMICPVPQQKGEKRKIHLNHIHFGSKSNLCKSLSRLYNLTITKKETFEVKIHGTNSTYFSLIYNITSKCILLHS